MDSKIMEPKDHIIAAVDTANLSHAHTIVNALHGEVGLFKLGVEMLYTLASVSLLGSYTEFVVAQHIYELTKGRLFLDPKLKDIPRTVAAATRVICSRIAPRMVTVYVSTSAPSLRGALVNKGESLVIGVTVPSSFEDDDSKFSFGTETTEDAVLKFAFQALDFGCDGIVCAPKDLTRLDSNEFRRLRFVVAGSRPTWAPNDDQKRVLRPMEAMRDGADYLVIGSPLTSFFDDTEKMKQAARLIALEIKEGLSMRKRRSVLS